MTVIETILALARAYGAAEGIEPKTVSWRVFKDSKKLAALESPTGDIQTRRAEATLQWFSDNWPDGAAWPEGVDRKPVSDEEAA